MPTQTPAPNPKPFLRPMEKVMLGMVGFFLTGIVIYGFIPPGQARSFALTAYVVLFVVFLYKPFGVKDRPTQPPPSSKSHLSENP